MRKSQSSSARTTSVSTIDRRIGATDDAIVLTDDAAVDIAITDSETARRALQTTDTAVAEALEFGATSLDLVDRTTSQSIAVAREAFDLGKSEGEQTLDTIVRVAMIAGAAWAVSAVA